MADFKIKYAAIGALTCDLTSLASSSSRVGGRESTAVDNTSTLYDDVLLSGKIRTGTTPTAGKQIDIWVYADDGNDVYPDVLDGTDSAETLTAEAVRNAGLRLAASILVDGTSNQFYYFRGLSIAALFGGVMPRKWGVFITHDTVAALHATGSDHEVRATGIHYQSV